MKLYYAPGTCALACWISLEWAGADYSVERVDPTSEGYRKVNPLGMVPAIDIGGPRVMTQADAILQFIAERFPYAALGPGPNPDDRFEFHETLSFLTGDFHPAFWPFFVPHRFTTKTDPDSLDAVRLASHDRVDRVLAHLDRLIGPSGHVHRNRRTVADAYAYVMTLWSERFPRTWRNYPGLTRMMQRMQADETVITVLDRSRR